MELRIARGGRVVNRDLEALRRQIEELERGNRRNKSGREPDLESEEEEELREEQVPDNPKARYMEFMRSRHSGLKIEISDYGGSVKSEEFLDWIHSLEKYFEWEEIEDPKRVKLACTKLKGHAAIWWEHLQMERAR